MKTSATMGSCGSALRENEKKDNVLRIEVKAWEENEEIVDSEKRNLKQRRGGEINQIRARS